MKTETLPQWLVEKATRIPDQAAMREKEFGIWQERTWSELLSDVKAFSLGLRELGFQPNDKLAIIGDNRPEWIIAQTAAQAAGGVSVGIYQDSLPKEIAYVLYHADAKLVVVEDQEQVDKLLEIEAEIPRVEKIIYYDRKGMRHYSHPLLAEFAHIQHLGRQSAAWETSLFYDAVEQGAADDAAILCYTSGTTGFPKGAMLTHRNLLNMTESLFALDPLTDKDEYLSFLPLAWIGEQMMAISGAFLVGFTVNFPEETSTVQADLREIGPHVMFSPPRIWEDMVSRVQVRLQDAGWFKRKMYELFRPFGERRAEASISGKKLNIWEKLMYWLGDYLVFSAIKDHLGLLRLKRAYTGGAALGSDVTKFFHSMGVNLKQIYGQTEIAGIAIVHHDGRIKFDTVGEPIPGTEMRISDKGEILLKSASVFAGYYKNEQATRETICDGWLHTGDAGYIDEDGHLVVIDRLKDVIRLESGEMFSPQYIENKLKFSPYIKEAVAVGTDRPYVAAILNIDMANVGRWAEGNQVAYTTYTDLSQKSEVLRLIRQEVARVNQSLPEKARVKRFVLLYKELDADDEELTRTRKVRRGFISKKYEKVLDGLYGENKLLDVEGTIKYRDGKEATIRARMEVVDVEEQQTSDGEVA
ncbi:MAG: AMP-binding protein [Brevibacillus sp.]|nr:AMP-binding protein [Brevibacillus sp.]